MLRRIRIVNELLANLSVSCRNTQAKSLFAQQKEGYAAHCCCARVGACWPTADFQNHLASIPHKSFLNIAARSRFASPQRVEGSAAGGPLFRFLSGGHENEVCCREFAIL